MRKAIFIVIFLLMVIGGLFQFTKLQALAGGMPLSPFWLGVDDCAQSVLAFLVSLFFGLPGLLAPKPAIAWLIAPLPAREQESIMRDVNFFTLRLFGLMLVVFAGWGILYSPC